MLDQCLLLLAVVSNISRCKLIYSRIWHRGRSHGLLGLLGPVSSIVMASSRFSRQNRQDHRSFTVGVDLAEMTGTWHGVSCEVQRVDILPSCVLYPYSKSFGVLHCFFQKQKFFFFFIFHCAVQANNQTNTTTDKRWIVLYVPHFLEQILL